MSLALLGVGILWGMSVPLTKVAVSTGHQPLGLIFWQMLFGAFALAPLVWWRKKRIPRTRSVLRFFIAIALIGTLIPNSFSYIAIAHIPAGVQGIVLATVPMFALLGALVLKVERFNPRRSVGVLLGAVAIVLIVAPEGSLPDSSKVIFVFVALIGAVCYGPEGHYINATKPAGVDPIMTLFGASGTGAILALFLAQGTDTWVDLSVAWTDAEWALLVGSICHIGAYTGYVWLVENGGAVFASQLSYVVTLSAVLLSGWFLGEQFSAWIWAALALMMIGISFVRPTRVESGSSQT